MNHKSQIEKAEKLVNRLDRKDGELTSKETEQYNKAMDILIECGFYHF